MRQFFLQLWFLSILQFCCLFQIIILLCGLDFFVQCFQFLTQLLYTLNGFLLVVPLCFLCLEFTAQLCQLFLKILQTLFAQIVFFFLQSGFFNLQLHYFTVQFIQLCRHGIQLCLDQCTGLVHKVDGFIRQETVRNVTVR